MSYRLGITLSDELLKAVKEEKEATGLSEAQVIRTALKEYFEARGRRIDARLYVGRPPTPADDDE
jgi:hypothetical protein